MNNWFYTWLQADVRGIRETIFYITLVLVLDFTYTKTVQQLLPTPRYNTPKKQCESLLPINRWLPLSLLFFAWIEEVVFRLPLSIAVTNGWSLSAILACAVFLSIIFGLSHGRYNIFIQGVSGIFLSLLFLKCSEVAFITFKIMLARQDLHVYNIFCIRRTHRNTQAVSLKKTCFL